MIYFIDPNNQATTLEIKSVNQTATFLILSTKDRRQKLTNPDTYPSKELFTAINHPTTGQVALIIPEPTREDGTPNYEGTIKISASAVATYKESLGLSPDSSYAEAKAIIEAGNSGLIGARYGRLITRSPDPELEAKRLSLLVLGGGEVALKELVPSYFVPKTREELDTDNWFKDEETL